MNEVAEQSPGWLQAGKNSKPIGRSYREVELLSAYSNHWPISHHPRRLKQKSEHSKSPEVPLLPERGDLWLWRSTSHRISWWRQLSVFDMPTRRRLSFRDVTIQDWKRPKITEECICTLNRSIFYFIDACTLRHSHDVSLGPWNYEARVKFY